MAGQQVDCNEASAVAIAAAAATAGAVAKVAAAAAAAAAAVPAVAVPREGGDCHEGQDEECSITTAVAPAARAEPQKTPAGAESVRFFIKGIGKCGEHHLKDHFEQFGEILEATLVRDKKTQRPRGMAFVTIAVTATGIAKLLDSILGESHVINDVEVEVQESLPRLDKEGEGPSAAKDTGATAMPVVAASETTSIEEEAAAMDSTALAQARAQWQMHYLAMAINISVPEVSPATATPPTAAVRGGPRPGPAPPQGPCPRQKGRSRPY